MAIQPIKIKFEPSGNTVVLPSQCTVLEAAKRASIGIRSECGGKGSCGKCKIIVLNPLSMSKPTEVEMQHLSKRKIQMGYRLACCSIIENDVTVMIPRESQTRKLKTLSKELAHARARERMGFDGKRTRVVKIAPFIQKLHLQLTKPNMQDARTDLNRILVALSDAHDLNNLQVSPGLLRTLPSILREAEWDITVTLWNKREIIDVEIGNTANAAYGFAVDIGTSKIAACLVHLATGKVVSVKSMENSQMIFGDDIISRIAYAAQGTQKLLDLQRSVIRSINFLMTEARKEAHIRTRNIYEISVDGNTAMHHLFLGIDPKHLSLAPYVPVVKQSLDIRSKELRIRMNPRGYVHILPNVAGYVGADAVADVLSSGIHKTSKMSLLVDIGTNGELFAGNKERLLSCSCAAGPAFEGAHIKHGIRASVGAIERIRIDPQTLTVEYDTIGNAKPIGICGSGILDAVAELFKSGIINTRGRFTKNSSTRLQMQKNEREFIIAKKEETDTGINITVTQQDIEEIQLAKAALHTGCAILMKRRGITRNDIDQLLIAGAFGNYINAESIRFIGLVPDVPAEKIKFVGNTALSGARITLLSQDARKTNEKLATWINYIELAADPDFKREYMFSTYLPYRNLDQYPTIKAYFEKQLSEVHALTVN